MYASVVGLFAHIIQAVKDMYERQWRSALRSCTRGVSELLLPPILIVTHLKGRLHSERRTRAHYRPRCLLAWALSHHDVNPTRTWVFFTRVFCTTTDILDNWWQTEILFRRESLQWAFMAGGNPFHTLLGQQTMNCSFYKKCVKIYYCLNVFNLNNISLIILFIIHFCLFSLKKQYGIIWNIL